MRALRTQVRRRRRAEVSRGNSQPVALGRVGADARRSCGSTVVADSTACAIRTSRSAGRRDLRRRTFLPPPDREGARRVKLTTTSRETGRAENKLHERSRTCVIGASVGASMKEDDKSKGPSTPEEQRGAT